MNHNTISSSRLTSSSLIILFKKFLWIYNEENVTESIFTYAISSRLYKGVNHILGAFVRELKVNATSFNLVPVVSGLGTSS